MWQRRSLRSTQRGLCARLLAALADLSAALALAPAVARRLERERRMRVRELERVRDVADWWRLDGKLDDRGAEACDDEGRGVSISTSTSGVDPNGDLFVYAGRTVSAVDKGFSITNGIYNQVNAGETAQLAGVVQIPGGSGQFQVVEGGSLTYRMVTITAGPPPPTPVSSLLPISTSVVGIDPSGNPVVYTPPNATVVPTGSIVTYGPPVTLTEAEALPVPSIVDVASGASPVQAVNLALWRQVTISPL